MLALYMEFLFGVNMQREIERKDSALFPED